MTRISVGLIAICTLWAPCLEPTLAQPTDANPHIATLKEFGITPDLAGVREFFNDLNPTPERRRRIDQLVRQLGGGDFSSREAAMRKLGRMPTIALEPLTKAARSPDREIAWRAKKVLKNAKPRASRVLLAVFEFIAESKLKGVAAEVLNLIPVCDEKQMQPAARRALVATTRRSDRAILRKAATSGDVNVRHATHRALADSLGNEYADTLIVALKDPSERIRVVAAQRLANLGHRKSLGALLKLMTSEVMEIRLEAYETLRRLTHSQLRFTPYASVERRLKQLRPWNEWFATKGKVAKLHFPLKDFSIEEGRTLVCLYGQHKVVELDRTGKQIRELKGSGGPWGVQRLRNGNWLVAWYDAGTVEEYDLANKVVWKKAGIEAPWNAQRLGNGNTLVATSSAAIEYDPEGNQVWSAATKGSLTDAQRLGNGHTLLVDVSAGKIVEVDRKGKTVWELEGLSGPYRVQRLRNGNTLVAEYSGGRVVEYNSAKKPVWIKDGIPAPSSAQRLSNGNTLIANGRAVFEVDRRGQVVWEKIYNQSYLIGHRY